MADSPSAALVISEVEAQARGFRARHELAVATGGVRDPQELAQLTVEKCCALLGVDYGRIYWWDVRLEQLVTLAVSERHHTALGTTTRAGEGIAGLAFLRVETVAVENYQEWEYAAPRAREIGVRSSAAVPLIVGERAVGSLLVGSHFSRSFLESELQILSVLAAQVGPALQAAELNVSAERARFAAASQAEELRRVYEAVGCGILVRDLRGTIVRVNSAAEEILGFSAAAMLGRTSDELWTFLREDGTPLPHEDRPSWQALRAGRSVRRATEGVLRPDGAIRWLQVDSVPILGEDGRPFRSVSSFIDITARKQAEAEFSQLNAELERRVTQRTTELTYANSELESFSYSVSHDLRAPLRSIDGFSLALLEDYAEQIDHVGKDYLRRIRASSQRMAELIDDLLTLARVSRGEMRHQDVDLSGIAETYAVQLREEAPGRDVTFVIEPGLRIKGDGHLLEIVLQNLLENAWKFTSRHATARIEFGACSIDGERACFVRDDGAGFEMAYAEKLFGPFQRLHTTADFAGTGIGLATVQRILQRHGGRAWAEGAIEAGATIYFTLPS